MLSSLASRLLSRFALFCLFLPRARDSMSDAMNTLRWQNAQVGTAVLHELLKLQPVTGERTCSLANRELSDTSCRELQFTIKNAETQRMRKRARRGNRSLVVDYEVFAAYGASVPRTSAQGILLMKSICDAHRRILKVCAGVYLHVA